MNRQNRFREKKCVRVVNDYADTCQRSQRQRLQPFLPVHMGPRSNLLSKKIGQKSRDTVPLRLLRFLN